LSIGLLKNCEQNLMKFGKEIGHCWKMKWSDFGAKLDRNRRLLNFLTTEAYTKRKKQTETSVQFSCVACTEQSD